ncbi:hypothetical protein DFH09DRAFT_1338612 [Mycena vulgaris]|nr:hypothetical protein DFH09DRAFT_1338612 [Mycena vulgaris]
MRYYACHDITPRSYGASAQSADAPPYVLIASLPSRTRYVDVTPPNRLSVVGPTARANESSCSRSSGSTAAGGAFAYEPSIHRPWHSPSVDETHPTQPADDESLKLVGVAPRLKGAEPKWSGDAATSSRTMPTPRSLRRGGSALAPRGGRSVDAQDPGGSPGGATSSAPSSPRVDDVKSLGTLCRGASALVPGGRCTLRNAFDACGATIGLQHPRYSRSFVSATADAA